jgi:hypothetical protein
LMFISKTQTLVRPDITSCKGYRLWRKKGHSLRHLLRLRPWKSPGAYDLREQKLIIARPQSLTESYFKNNLTERHNPCGAVALARKAESEALAECTRVLLTFTELNREREISEEHSVAGSNGL